MDYFRSILSFPLLVLFLGALLVFESHCSVHTLSLFTRFNGIVLASESISLICSLSDTKPEDDITMLIVDGRGPNFELEPVPDVTVYTQQTSADIIIESNRTFTCIAVGGNFTASRSLTISPLPNRQTHCTTDNTDGILVGQTVTLTCYSYTSVSGSISWSSDSDVTFEEEISNIRSMTMTNTINVQPSVSQNGTVFTCERDGVAPVTDIDRCSIGPINVYEKLIVFIDPINATDPAILYPGQTKNYTCSSLPTSSVEWTIPNKLDDSGIEFSVVGSMITVHVTTYTTFIGDVRLNCSANILDQTAVASITLAISPLESPTTNSVSSKPPGNSFLVVSSVTVIGILLFTLSIILVLLYRKRRQTESNSKSVANVTSSANVGYDYCDIDTGGVATTVSSNTEATTISENSPNSKEQYSRVIINENESVAYEIPDAKMGNENPSKRTIIDEKGNESEYYENPEKFNFETYGPKESKL